MGEFAVWALGADRPGIVAAVTGVLYGQGCNVEDCSMTLLSQHFAIMMLVRAPHDVSAGALEEGIRKVTDPLGLTVAVRELAEGRKVEVSGEPWMVAVYGADRPGIVHRVSEVLAEAGVNITDLNTRVIGDPDEPVYAMHMEVTVPAGVDAESLEQRLAEVAEELGVDTSLHPLDADVL